MKRAAAAVAIAGMLSTRSAFADEAARPPARWVPTTALALGSFDERLRVRVDGADYTSDRATYRTFLALGVGHPLVVFRDERLAIDGHAGIGVGPTFETGHWHVLLREDVTFAYSPAHWLTLRAGLGLGFSIDGTTSQRSFAELALPISFTLFRTIEIVYRPMMSVPVGGETTPVFGGERERSARFAVLPFELMLRFRIGALAW